jgi:hypothetical protein
LLAQFLGWKAEDLTRGRMSYDLRRLRLHGLIERLTGSQRYRLTPAGLKVALFCSRTDQHVIRPGLSVLPPPKKTFKLQAWHAPITNSKAKCSLGYSENARHKL